MRNKLLLKFISTILTIAFVLSFGLVFSASFDGFTGGTPVGWASLSDGRHMGSRFTTYSYSSNPIKTAYSSYVEAGIALWGSAISCTERGTGLSAMGTITTDTTTGTAYAEVTDWESDSNLHTTSWTITIYVNNFNTLTDQQKASVIAHEIGHVYGLAHIADSSSIMTAGRFNHFPSPTEQDLHGMSVMTHSHTHNGDFPKSYVRLGYTDSGYKHRVVCETCLGRKEAYCSSYSYHSGDYHYYVVDCICGQYNVRSWACSGNPCIEMNSVLPEVETE